MILFINTSDFESLDLALVDNDVKVFETKLAYNENYKTNELLDKFLKGHGVAPTDLTSVIVCSGPGSFTGIRVGVALAQALGLALEIPVHAVPKEKIPNDLLELITMKMEEQNQLHYGAEPNITKNN